jgi:succinylarginine dihydrolase
MSGSGTHSNAFEANFDGLVGPTHNYSGIAAGNLASAANRMQASNPRLAALQGLDKMLALARLGFAQGVLPPQERPDVRALRRLGFAGDDANVIRAAARDAPAALSWCSSAASMWVANAATVSPAADTADGRVHFTPANLASALHRALEAPTTARVLATIFADARHFAHHEPLPAAPQLGDEGAANHTRLCSFYGAPGVELFVYGRDPANPSARAPMRYPARQTRAASEAVARLHGLRPEQTVFAQQNPDAIDTGVFHNDVIAVGNRNVLFFHELAFADKNATLAELRDKLAPTELIAIEVPASRISLESAVATYLFNSQLLTRADGRMILVAPSECATDRSVSEHLDALLAANGPIAEVVTFELRQSMQNGGGPACLRLRVVLDDASRAAVLPSVWLDERLHAQLAAWVNRHYRDRLLPSDLGDPSLLVESRTALDELTQLLKLGSLYPFQRNQ